MSTIFRKGKKVILRPLEQLDARVLSEWMNDPTITQYLRRMLPITLAEEEEWIASLSKRSDTNIVLGIETLEHILIGTIGLHSISWVDRVATTGTVIGNSAYHNCGYGTDAKMLLLEYAFNTLGLRKICSCAYAFNARSVRYSEKCGYHVEGVLKAQHFHDGAYHDEVHLAVFRDDWLAAWKTYTQTHK